LTDFIYMHENLLLAGVLGVKWQQKNSPFLITANSGLVCCLVLQILSTYLYHKDLKPGVHIFSKSLGAISKF
jgi:hypothetical protein